MKKIRSICGKTLLLFLCTVLLLLAGCSSSKEEEEPKEHPLYNIEMTDENSMEITLVNASGYPVQEVATWWGGEQVGFDLLHNLDRDLEPDESITVRIPRWEYNIYSYLAEGPKENGLSYFYGHGSTEIPEGGVIVLLPSERYDDQIQTIFEAGTDVETAKETALSQYQAACDAELEAEKAAEKAAEEEAKRLEEEKRQEEERLERLANLSQEEIDEAVKLLGYNSLADMRKKEHPDIRFRDYDEDHDSYCELYGYWYPDGDRNSKEYFVINDGAVKWYIFDPEKGDVEKSSHRFVSKFDLNLSVSDWEYHLANGDSFTLHRAGVLAALSDGTITFSDGGTEYYYSRY